MDTSVVDKLIQGRVEPSIYAFSTGTIPDYLKVGDTYRPVKVRLDEWKKYYDNLKLEFEGSAKTGANKQVYFRDYAVHDYLVKTLGKYRLTEKDLKPDVYFSNEFFKDTSRKDIQSAISDIKKDFQENTGKYVFYDVQNSLPHYEKLTPQGLWKPRKNQADVIKAFEKAVKQGRKNLLMYAVMRFGKSFTAMCCAKKVHARFIVVVSAKADVCDEWRKTVECAENFCNDYDFITPKNVSQNYGLISSRLKDHSKPGIVLFLTLQDLQGKKIKEKHKQIFSQKVDLLIVDETHFGARAESYGEILKNTQFVGEKHHKYEKDDYIETEEAEDQLKAFKASVTLHLSGTPYRILMGSEFQPEDIIAFCQFSDIVKAKDEWDQQHLQNENVQEWDNPYFGFPQMIRFAFNPNESARKRLADLRSNGFTFALSALLRPQSICRMEDGSHQKFVYEKEVFDLLKVIDGSAKDKHVLSFLDYPKIKDGKMCRHMVVVLPYCASCDAMEKLLKDHAKEFKNLRDYKILNISGVDSPAFFKAPNDVKSAILDCEKENRKTITLTVNRMLTGSTVEQWDTMLFLKDTASPQEYDQAIFRLQNQYVVTIPSTESPEQFIKINMKPQTLLVDFDPSRMFRMQEAKAQIYNVNIDEAGNSKLQARIEEELRISPIIAVNADKNRMEQIQPVDIMNAVSEYSGNRGVIEETREIPIDASLLNNPIVMDVIKNENELGSKAGFEVKPADGEGTDMETPSDEFEPEQDQSELPAPDDSVHDSTESFEKRFRMYYTRILYYAFLTKNPVLSVGDILKSLKDSGENRRIFKNLGLSEAVLKEFLKMDKFILRSLDYAVQHLNQLSHDSRRAPLERAEVADKKFGKLGQSQIVTPAFIADKMVALLPDKFLKKCVKNQRPILDIASKKGEFAIALSKRFEALGFTVKQYRELIYSIPTSSICYEFTRKVYGILGLNIQMLASKFTSYDLLTVKDEKGNIDYSKIRDLLSQDKPFDLITINDDLGKQNRKILNMKFEAIIGNPPYQEETAKQQSATNGQATCASIFQYYQIAADNLTSMVTILIYPGARWLHRSGKGMKNFGLSQINDVMLKRIDFYPDSQEIFKDVAIADGITVVLKDRVKTISGFEYVYHENNQMTSVQMNAPGESLISLNPHNTVIVDKISNFIVKNNLSFLHDRILPRSLFGIESDFVEKNPSAVREYTGKEHIDYTHEIKLFTNDKAGKSGRAKWYIADKDIIPDGGQKYLKEWQVIVSSANAGGQKRDNQISIADNHSAFGRARVALGSFKTKKEAENFYKYANTEIIRFMFLMTDESLTSLGKKVPDIGDYSDKNTWVDFSGDLDAQLYALLGIEQEEIAFIESMIKPIE